MRAFRRLATAAAWLLAVSGVALAGGSTAPGIVQSGSVTPGNCAQFSANGVAIDAGATCGTGTAGVIQSTGTANQVLVNGNTAAHTGATTYSLPNAVIIGTASTATGTFGLNGVTSGTVTIQPQSAAGTYNFNLPTAAGTAGQPLLSGGGSGAAQTYGTLSVAAGGTGATTLTAHGVLLGEGTSAVAAVAAMTNGQLLIGATGADPAPQTMSQDCTITAAGVITCLSTNNVAFGTAATKNTGTSGANVPLLNGANTWSGTQTFGTIGGYLATVTTDATTTRTLGASDCGTFIKFTSASAVTVTLPNSLSAGCQVAIEQNGAGQVTLSAGSGAALHSAHSYTKTFGQYGVVGVTVDGNSGGSSAVYVMTGDGA